MKRIVINLTLFQIGWFACVLGAAAGYPIVGVLYVATWVGLHIYKSSNPISEMLLAAGAAVTGYVTDSILVGMGYLTFPVHAALGSPSTLWMTAMWVNFAATINTSMNWLKGRYLLAALLGLISGPLAYYTGMRLDAIAFEAGVWPAIIAIGIQWAICLPLVLWIAHFANQVRCCQASNAKMQPSSNNSDASEGMSGGAS